MAKINIIYFCTVDINIFKYYPYDNYPAYFTILILEESTFLADVSQFIVASVLAYLRMSDKASKHVVVEMYKMYTAI